MKFDQCLFGYDDGHRLLASSLPLGTEASFLTELSDLAPGTVFGRSSGYWTGIPVPSIGRYVLMRTWPAPEMARPGCVWTRALLIEPTLLESISDLSILQTVLSRPNGTLELERYRVPIDVDLPCDYGTKFEPNALILNNLLSSLYEMISTTVEVQNPGELDAPLFAAWSQQWPRLRRNFRFQTATSRTLNSEVSTRFDIKAVLTSQEKNDEKPISTLPSWLSAAAQDIQQDTSGHLRSFLWRYGRDVRRQRGSFRPLVELSLLDQGSQPNSTKRIVDIVTEAFPTLDDAMCVKQDLVDGVLVAHTQVELLLSIVLNEIEEVSVFPPPTAAGLKTLAHLWPQRANELLQLAEMTVGSEKPISKQIFESIIGVIQTPEFWHCAHSYPRICEHMVKVQPKLLINAVSKQDDSRLIKLLPLVPTNTSSLDLLVAQLTSRNNETLVNIVFDLFPDIAAAQIITELNNTNSEVESVWRQALINRPELLLRPENINLVSRESLLYEIADSLSCN
jgi:hypothetical protein